MAMKRIATSRVRKAERHLSNEDGRKELPQLWSFLAEAQIETDKGVEDREPGTVWIGPRHGKLQCVLKEPSQGLILRVEVESLKGLLTVLESALGAEGSMWEADQMAPPRSKGKRR